MNSQHGFTLIETLAVCAIIGVLSVIAVPRLFGAIDLTRRSRAIWEIGGLQRMVDTHYGVRGTYPAAWEDLGEGPIPDDPWGRPYVYIRHEAAAVVLPPPPPLLIRTEGLIVPINDDYDIFSAGPDGQWVPDILDLLSADDVIRGRNGSFIGLAEEF